MTYKLTTQLSYFRLNNSRTTHEGPFHVTWYVLDVVSGSEEDARCFKDMAELQQFQDYTVRTPLNFDGAKNYHTCSDEETPYCGTETFFPVETMSFPTKVILRKVPQKSIEEVNSCMDIILVDKNGDDTHSYELDFDVVGEIQIRNKEYHL